VNKERGEKRKREGETLEKGTTYFGALFSYGEEFARGFYIWFFFRSLLEDILLVFLQEFVGGLSHRSPLAGNFGLGAMKP